MDVRPITLHGSHVRLEPLSGDHVPDLFEAGRDPEIWTYMLDGPLATVEATQLYVQDVLARAAILGEVAFAIVHRPGGRAVGSTRYMSIDPPNHALEIGGTWLDSAYWRTPVNTECKYLLLRHAFEDLGALRVQLKTDSRNVRSQNAIARLGAAREGVLRKQMIAKGGYHRDSVMYSITDVEWPAVKSNLEDKLEGRRSHGVNW